MDGAIRVGAATDGVMTDEYPSARNCAYKPAAARIQRTFPPDW